MRLLSTILLFLLDRKAFQAYWEGRKIVSGKSYIGNHVTFRRLDSETKYSNKYLDQIRTAIYGQYYDAGYITKDFKVSEEPIQPEKSDEIIKKIKIKSILSSGLEQVYFRSVLENLEEYNEKQLKEIANQRVRQSPRK